MFALYLDIQKGKVLEDMDEVEARGRWKSFLGKWYVCQFLDSVILYYMRTRLICLRNRGELSEGWYDPTTFHKAVQSTTLNEPRQSIHQRPVSPPPKNEPVEQIIGQTMEDSDSDDSIGPVLPGLEGSSRNKRLGPSIPNMDDLQLKRGMSHLPYVCIPDLLILC